MVNIPKEIQLILEITVLILGLVVFIVLLIITNQRKVNALILEKINREKIFDQEIFNAENEIQESIMKHISRELHDNVGQMLTLVKIQLNNLSEEAPENKRIVDSKEFITTALKDIRALSKSLNSDNLLHEGLEKAIGFELDRLKKLGNYTVIFYANYGNVPFDHKKEVLIFRIFQELLQNCLKHAKAKNIEVNLEETNQCLNLEVVDDGIGFDFEAKIHQEGYESGSGLKNLIHRANLMKGTLVFEKGKVSGTKALLSIPV